MSFFITPRLIEKGLTEIPTPIIELDFVCVMLMGKPNAEATPITAALEPSAQTPSHGFILLRL